MRRAAVLICMLACSGRRPVEPRLAVDGGAAATPADAGLARDANGEPRTLHEAALRCDHDRMAKLVAEGAEVDARNPEGRTPLHEAAGRCALSIVRLLVGAGADVRARDADGMTPLHESCAPARVGGQYAISRGGDPEVVSFLIAQGADPNAAARTGWTPLHAAAQVPNGGADVVALLLDRGAQIEVRDVLGWTPLHHAARFDAIDVIRLLVARGATLDARTGAPRTVLTKVYPAGSAPLDIARIAGSKRASDVLQQHP